MCYYFLSDQTYNFCLANDKTGEKISWGPKAIFTDTNIRVLRCAYINECETVQFWFHVDFMKTTNLLMVKSLVSVLHWPICQSKNKTNCPLQITVFFWVWDFKRKNSKCKCHVKEREVIWGGRALRMLLEAQRTAVLYSWRDSPPSPCVQSQVAWCWSDLTCYESLKWENYGGMCKHTGWRWEW